MAPRSSVSGSSFCSRWPSGGRWRRGVGLIALLLLPRFALADPGDLVVTWTDVRQNIDGWGASDAFGAPDTMSDPQADLFFDQTAGIGLSFLRVGIQSDGTDYASTANITKASARGAKVWAVPWTAPAAWKDNNSTSNGGHLCAAAGQGTCTASHYDDWATRLASFVTNIEVSTGVDIYAISVQNEPDYAADYDSMLYTNQEMVNFVKVLGPKLAVVPVRPKLMCGEYADWANLWWMATAIEGDPTALAYTDIYAAHQYSGVSAYQGPRPCPIWQTEMSSFDTFDASIAHGVTVAKWIWDAIVNGNVTAWHYWWLDNLNADNEGLISSGGAVGKHLYTFGNYSKFVRPGWVRVGASGLTNPSLYATAYKNGTTGDFAIVVVNDSGGDLSFAASFTGAIVASVTPYITDATRNLVAQTAVMVTTGRFTYTVPYGVTTFIGNVATNTPTCIPGQGKNACMLEWFTEPATVVGRNGLPAHQLTCTDGDPSCDFDGTAGTCTFHVGLCLNVQDPRIACTPTDVQIVQALQPAPGRAGTTDTANRSALETALGQVGGHVQGVCIRPVIHRGQFCTAAGDCNSAPETNDGTCLSLVNFSPALAATNMCTGYAPITVPLRQTTRGSSPGTKRLRITAAPSVSSPTLRDTDSLTLICKPHS